MSDTERPAPVALFDLDGTLADFDEAMEAGMFRLANPAEIEAGDQVWFPREQAKEPAHIRNRRKFVKTQPGFWRNLPVIELGYRLLNEAISLGFKCSVLTKAPRTNFPAWAEKVEWCHANLPMEQGDIGTNLVTDKGLVYGRLLVDDFPEYVDRWLAHRPRGRVIMPAWPWNEGYSHPRVTRVARDASGIAAGKAVLYQVRSLYDRVPAEVTE